MIEVHHWNGANKLHVGDVLGQLTDIMACTQDHVRRCKWAKYDGTIRYILVGGDIRPREDLSFPSATVETRFL